jgi:hypothetical protein
MLDFILAAKGSVWYGSAELRSIYIVNLQGYRNTDVPALMGIKQKWLNMSP